MPGEAQLRAYRTLIDARLPSLLPPEDEPPTVLHRAMRYAVLGDGKRIRPAFAMASALAAGGTADDGIEAGCAVELVHCFSLIHDDLPAIDDDDLRRGRPTVHRAFKESVAILAGDALFALAFDVLARLDLSPERVVRAIRILAGSVGSQGLVGGEMMDVEAEGSRPDLPTVTTIHTLKTASLVAASCRLGAIAAGASDEAIEALGRFGGHIGVAFQIVDDLLNETSTAETLGKSAGSDRERDKATYPAVVGINASEAAAQAESARAYACVEGLPGDRRPLVSLAEYCLCRDR
ncbi:MAG: polyprenyl synthetase family protein [Armatimonadetes bacterium]|nr:polyprenyl synthetase family protein [Armatimonadota bacterium]